MNTPVSIIIPAYNQLDYCRACVESVLANTRPPYRLILVDNGSTDGVAEYFDSVPGARVVHAGANRGFAGGVNLGMAHAEGHLLLLNSDTLVPVGWLERLLGALDRSPVIGMAGPRSNWVSGHQQLDAPDFDSLESLDAFAAQRAAAYAGQVRETARLVGFCLLIRDAVWRQVGPFDEAYGAGNFEDDDYCVRVLQAGYRLCIAEDAFVFHYGGRTFQGMGLTGEAWNQLMERNERRFRAKWRIDSGASGAVPAAADSGGVTVREYRPEDHDEWMRVHAMLLTISHAWNYAIQERPEYPGYESTRLVAVADARLVGLTDVMYENIPGELCLGDQSRGGYVLEFGRLPEYAGRNIGKRLIHATVADAARKGFHRLQYWTQDRAAQRYYRRIGLKEIGRHYRFRMRAPDGVAEALAAHRVSIEYLYAACPPEDWPLVKKNFEVVQKHPLEPHLCVGFELAF